MPDETPVSKSDFVRLETKVDQLHKDYQLIILMQERQAEQGKRIGELEQRMKADEDVTTRMDRAMNSWVNRGIGVWSVAVALFALSNAKWLTDFFTRH